MISKVAISQSISQPVAEAFVLASASKEVHVLVSTL